MKPDLLLQKKLLRSLGFSFLEQSLEIPGAPSSGQQSPGKRANAGAPPPPRPDRQNLAPFSSLPNLTIEERKEGLEAIAREVAGCQRCLLSHVRQTPLSGEGPLDPAFALILEIPSPEQDKTGRLNAGEVGGLLGRIVEAIGSSPEDCFITFAAKCHAFPFRPPHAQEVEACRPYLVKQMELARPGAIICFGPAGLEALLPSAVAKGPNASRGKVLDYRGVPILMTLPLPAIMSHRTRKRTVWEDLQRLITAGER